MNLKRHAASLTWWGALARYVGYNDQPGKCNGRAVLPLFINRQNVAEWSMFMKKGAGRAVCGKLEK